MYICRYCGKTLKRPCALGIHERTCRKNPDRKPLENHVCGYSIYQKKSKSADNEIYHCKHCGKACKNKNSHRNHERLCPHNPDRNYKNGMLGKNAWNKGLTKETDERVKRGALSLKEKYDSGKIVSPQKGKSHTKEEKQHLSEIRKEYLKQHPDKVPYVLNHHSKGDSYPEKYFKKVFDNENIVYEQNYYQLGYFLDFAWPEKKVYIEIDGEQHYSDIRIVEHDKKRTEDLNKNGWTLLYRIRWKDYKKLSEKEKAIFIEEIIKTLGSVTQSA